MWTLRSTPLYMNDSVAKCELLFRTTNEPLAFFSMPSACAWVRVAWADVCVCVCVCVCVVHTCMVQPAMSAGKRRQAHLLAMDVELQPRTRARRGVKAWVVRPVLQAREGRQRVGGLAGHECCTLTPAPRLGG
jgi:hypothetical protein